MRSDTMARRANSQIHHNWSERSTESAALIRRLLYGLTSTVVCLLLCSNRAAIANVTMPSIFGDHMVLQSDAKIRLFGCSSPHESISATFAGSTIKTQSSASGEWSAALGPFKPGTRGNLVIRGDNELVFKDVLVGEVWLCAGQSNMALPIKDCRESDSCKNSASKYSDIRFFCVPPDATAHPLANVVGHWIQCDKDSIADLSALGYMFARELHQKLNRPIGIIQSAYGGSSIVSWLSPDAERLDRSIRPYTSVTPGSPAQYIQYVMQKREDEKKAKLSQRHSIPNSKNCKLEPEPPTGIARDFDQPLVPHSVFNAMISPVLPFKIKGIVWYQGEADAEHPKLYARLFPLLIESWRHSWKDDLPFLFVQLPNFEHSQTCHPTKNAWAEFRDVQSRATKMRHTEMVVSIDQGELYNLHPKEKEVVAHRLTLVALKNCYGERDITDLGPELVRAVKLGDHIVCSFNSANNLHTVPPTSPPEGFQVRAANGRWIVAPATIHNNSVYVDIHGQAEPRGLRYGWANDPKCNLYNGADLPMVPFNTKLTN
ncbi:MAG TPA: sialate O-acetylesterase [Oculatellaceae cyanobacterium]